MIFDRDTVQNRLLRLKEHMDILRSLQSYKIDEFKNDPKIYGSVEHFLQVSIECCIDIGNHLISRMSLRRPDGYSDVFRILGETGVIPEDFTRRLEEKAKFRNRIVHVYWDIDLEEVYKILQEDLGDFEKFSKYISELVLKEEI